MSYEWYKSYPADIPHEIDLSGQVSIAGVFEKTCKKYASLPAVTCLGATITYSQLGRLSDKFAMFLQNGLHLKKGDRIAIMLPNVIQFPIAFLAAQKLGLVCVNTNPLYTPREMEHQFKDSGAKAIIILDLFIDKLEKILNDTQIESVVVTGIGDQLPLFKSILVKLVLKLKRAVPSHSLSVFGFKDCLKSFDGSPQAPEIGHDDLAILQYTGGTTGLSKGAMLTQKNVLANMNQIVTWAGNAISPGRETVLTALPLYHIFALSVNFLSFLTKGCHLVLVPKPVPIKNTVKIFKSYKITALTGVNTLYNALNNDQGFRELAPKSIKFALAGGMALQESVSKAWQQITGIEITEGFGLTESSPVTHCNPLNSPHPVGSCGLPLPSTIAKIVDEEGNEVATGSVGELLVRGPQVMKGYWHKPEETSETVRDGWSWTGDVAKKDDQGFFFIVDRKKDMIIVSGFNVYPNEIEEVLAAHPKVLEAAVIGVADEKCGESVKAFVVKKSNDLTVEELKDYCAENLTNYKRPKIIEFRDELPKTNVGKILRRELRES